MAIQPIGLTTAESYLVALIQDESGIDLAEFLWEDSNAPNEEQIFRCWDFQYAWWRDTFAKGQKVESKTRVIDACGRTVGKTQSIIVRAWSFPIQHPGSEMVVTAPELIHLDPLTSRIEDRIKDTRITREMLPKRVGLGFKHRPFHVNFVNGAKILGRIPQRDGRGMKGLHPLRLELDEGQDFPRAGWVEVTETLLHGKENAQWRAHGVSRGVRDEFFAKSQPNSGWVVHQICLPAGTLVYGVDGPFPIEEATVGTKVWSIEGGQLVEDEVTATIDNGVKYTWRVHAKGGLDLETTPNHPYLVLSRTGTRRTRRELSFEWVEAQDVRPGDYILGVDHLDSTGSEVPSVDEISQMLMGHSSVREVPAWVWRAARPMQMAFLTGYLMGDGSLSHQKRGQEPWSVGTSSEKMARQLRALCHYLGLRPTSLRTEDNSRSIVGGVGVIWTFYAYPGKSWFWQIPKSYSEARDGAMLSGLDKRLLARQVSVSGPTDRAVHTYDISVGTHHNYIAEGVVVHNTGMHRPTWSDAERQAKIEEYGSRNSPDYKRNILGEHGDATNPLFVLHRLMAIVDDDKGSDYNENVFYLRRVTEEMLREQPLELLIDPPRSHQNWKNTWAGMDIGLTSAPSEILIWGEETQKGQADVILRLLARFHLERISSPDQRRVVELLFRHYNLRMLTLDRGGMGLPIFQEIQTAAPQLLERVTAYTADENVVVGYDEHEDWEDPGDYEIKRRAKEYGYDLLRVFVDKKRLILPWDRDLLVEWQGQTWTPERSETNPYGRKIFSRGKFHTLDAAAMMILGKELQLLESLQKAKQEQEIVPLIML